MDEDSLSRDCEPFFESDGEEESTDGKRAECRLQVATCAWIRFVLDLHLFVLGSLSEDAPPPSRSMAMGQPAFSSRHAHSMALARSLPVSVPVWGCRGTRGAQGDGNSGERVSFTRSAAC